MAFKQNGNIITDYFNAPTNPKYTTANNEATGFTINGKDISSNYLGIGSSHNIPVSILFPTNFSKNNVDIASLYELNLVNYPATSATYKIWNPSDHNGLLIQFVENIKTTAFGMTFDTYSTISFNYVVDISFVIIGGGGGGGQTANSNAGGGGGAGELIYGMMSNVPANKAIEIFLGKGGGSDTDGANTTLSCNGVTITANGGGAGGGGKGSSSNQTGSSTGGSGSWSAGSPSVGTANSRNISDTGYFNTMTSGNNEGGLGQDQNNDSGAGGGGGGAGGAGETVSGSAARAGNGGNGKTRTYGSTTFLFAGGGGGGARASNYTTYKIGGTNNFGGGTGGGDNTNIAHQGEDGDANTGGGGGGGGNSGSSSGNGGTGGSGTVILYIIPSYVST
jgi:hypothetical protein